MGLFSWIGDVFGGGNKKAEQGRQQQEAAYKQALAELQKNYGMGIDTMRGDYGKGIANLQGTNVESGPSAMKNISVNPALRSAQMRALGQLQGEAAAGGLTAEDKMALEQSKMATQAQERGQRGAIEADAAQRGMAGGGASLANKMASQQAGAQQNYLSGLQTAGDARKRALAAMSGAGNLGGQMEAQQFGEQAQAAQAQDAINRFNAGQRLSKASNVGQMYGGMGNMSAGMYGKLGEGLASGQQSLGDMYNIQGAAKKKENQGTWGIGDAILGGLF